MVNVPIPPNHRVNFNKDVNRMDLTTHQSPLILHSEMTQLDPNNFMSDLTKKYSVPPYVYKHVYVTSPEASTTQNHEKKKRKKKVQDRDDSWMEYLNPFGCEEEYYDYDDYTYYLSSDEQPAKTKTKLKTKKKKKKILIKLLIIAAILFAAKCIITQLYYYFPTFFPTTGRDELYDDVDQLYNDGINLDRVGDYGKAQEISTSYRSVFSPDFDETKIALSSIESSGSL